VVFANQAMTQLTVCEIFYSLQGEALAVGLPAVFIRLTGCPLRCSYCDTAYAFGGGEELEIPEILRRVAAHECREITVTGGEPLWQEGCGELLVALCDAGYRVSLETCGALDLSRIDPRVTIVMDIKTPGSGESERNLPENVARLKPGDQIKFVICDESDYLWTRDLLRREDLASRNEVLILPAYGRQDPAQLAEWILRDHLPVRFQLQLHKILWGDEPGH
jgi:7-carboxy-7-deazaguanine synthase